MAEQWGRRWITIDTSRVALALARSRVMGARYPYYLLADSEEGHRKELELGGSPANTNDKKFYHRLRHGFVYERVPHITLKSIANNTEIDVIWDQHKGAVDAAREELNAALRGHKTPFRIEAGGRQGKSLDFPPQKAKRKPCLREKRLAHRNCWNGRSPGRLPPPGPRPPPVR